MRNLITVVLLGIFVCAHQQPLVRAQTFDLVVPDTATRSVATFQGNQLQVVDDAGVRTIYDRARQYDTPDFMGFVSRSLGQAVRFPLSGTGHMEFGMLAPGGVQFQMSQMVVRPRQAPGPRNPVNPLLNPAGPLVNPGLPIANGNPLLANPRIDQQITYSIQSALAPGLVLAAVPRQSGNVYLAKEGSAGSRFQLIPTANEYFMIVLADDPTLVVGIQNAIAGQPVNATLLQRPALPSPHMEFRTLRGAGGHVSFVSRAAPGCVLDVENGDQRPLTNIRCIDYSGLDGQLFRLVKESNPIVAPPLRTPGRTLVTETVTPRPSEPVDVQLFNSHKNELWVLIMNLRTEQVFRRVKIPSGKSQTVKFQRDPGTQIIQIFDVVQPDGTVIRDEVITELPGKPIYDISVYELAAQSVYIDATRPDSTPEIGRTPRSVGYFVVPANLKPGKSDVYQAAKRRENVGGVRRIDLKKWGLPGEQRYQNAFDRLTQ